MNDLGSITLKFDIITTQSMRALENLEKKMQDLAKSSDNVQKQINNTLNNIKNNSAKVNVEVDSDKLNRNLDNTYNLISTYFGYRTIKAVVDVAVDAAKINYEMLDGKIAGDMSSDEFVDYKANIRAVSDADSIDMSEVVKAANTALSNDISKNDIAGVMDLAGKLKISNSSNIGSATGVLTSIKNSMGLDINELQDVADMLTKANFDLGNVDLSALSNGLKQNSALLASGRISLGEYLAMAQVLTSQGIGQEETQTFIGNYINTVMQASEETKKWAKENLNLNFSMKHLKEIGVGDFTKEVFQKTGGNDDALAKLFGNIRGQKAFDGLIKGANKYNDALKGLKNSAGYLDEVTKEKTDDPYFKYQQSVNKLKNSLMEIGVALTPILTTLANAFTFIANCISTVPAPLLQVIAGVIIAISAFTMISNVMNIASSAIDNVSTFFTTLSKKTAESGMSLLQFVGKGLTVIAFLATLVYGIWFVYKNWDYVWAGIVSIGSLAAAAIIKIMQAVVSIIESAVQGCLNIISSVYNKAAELGVGIKNFFTGGNDKAATIDLQVNKVSGKLGKAADDLVQYQWDYVGKVNKKHTGNENKSGGIDINPFDDFMEIFNQNADKAEGLIDERNTDIADKLINGSKDAINKANNAVNDAGNKANNSAGKGAKNAGKNVNKTTDAVNDNKKSWDDLKNSLEQVADSFNDVSAKFEQMTYKVINSTDLLKLAQYNLQITTSWQQARNKLLNNSNLSGYALDYIASLDSSNLGELKALMGLSNKDLSAWNSAMNKMNVINTSEAGKTTIINNNYTINRVKDDKGIINYVKKQGKKQGWAK